MATPHKVYALTRDVKNPNGDKRQKYDWKAAPVWPAGMRFVVVDRRTFDFETPRTAAYVMPEEAKGYSQAMPLSADQARMLAAAWIESAPSLDSSEAATLAAGETPLRSIDLACLVRLGFMPQAIAEAYRDMWNAAQDAAQDALPK